MVAPRTLARSELPQTEWFLFQRMDKDLSTSRECPYNWSGSPLLHLKRSMEVEVRLVEVEKEQSLPLRLATLEVRIESSILLPSFASASEQQ